MDNPVREDFFMASRDRVRKNEVYEEVVDHIKDALREHAGLRQLNAARRKKEIEDTLSNESETKNLFAELLKGGPVTWEGKTRAALLAQDVVPHLESGPFPAWIGVGGNPQSVIRAARLGFSLALAIIGGPPSRFAAYSELFRRALEKFGQPPRPVLVHSPGHVAPTDEQAKAEFWPRWREVIALVAEERGFAIPSEASFDREAGPDGALYVGSPETVANKIAANVRALGATRFDLKYGLPGLTHDQLMTTVELYGREVIPRVRELLG